MHFLRISGSIFIYIEIASLAVLDVQAFDDA